MDRLKILLLLLIIITISGCVSEQERRGVSHRPFNMPASDRQHSFNGDF